MILKLPTGDMRAPTFALVDTTATAIVPYPNVWHVSQFYASGGTVRVDDRHVHVRPEAAETFAASAKLDPDDVRRQIHESIEASRVKWRTDAESGLCRDYHNAHVILPGGESVDTHATMEEIERAIAGASGMPIITVFHGYPPLPDFDERGLPPGDLNADDCPF